MKNCYNPSHKGRWMLMNQTSKTLLLVTAILEAILGIPVLGGIIILSLLWIPLGIMLILHIVTLIYCAREGNDKHGSILGIITSVLAVIPFIGMMMHIVTAVLLFVSATKKTEQK